jgi:hypothetical protein
MTREQFERWRDFALRMARTVYPATMRSPSRKWIVEQVGEFLDRLDGNGDVPAIVDWDGSHGSVIVTDEMSRFEHDLMPWCVERIEDDEEHEDARERWWGPVRCCVRAGLDLASAPSAGVVGFTIGDLRRMYPEGLPVWIAGGFHSPRGGKISPRRIARLPDSEPVWL